MLTVILANCVTLTMQSNKPGFDQSSMGQALAVSNVVFIALFIFEAACKIIALGFVFAEHTYLRSGKTHSKHGELPYHIRQIHRSTQLKGLYTNVFIIKLLSLMSGWNILDFIVVVMGILELSKLGTYTFIRCFRVLRPLRLVTKIEALRVRGIHHSKIKFRFKHCHMTRSQINQNFINWVEIKSKLSL